MSEHMDFKSLKALKKKMQEENQQRYLDESKKRLSKIVETKLKTAFIGALSNFEQEFGFLWGHGQKSDPTEEQEFIKEIWERTRTSVLNNGNNQIRAVRSEIANHSIEWQRYRTELPVKPMEFKEDEDV
jgi:transcription termination factor Rho